MGIRASHEASRLRRRATLLGLTAILLWSSSVALVRRTGEGLGPLVAGAAVYLLAGLLLIPSARSRPAGTQRVLPRRYLYGCGALFVAYMVAFFLALNLASDRMQVIEVGLLNYLWPALTLVLSVPLLGFRAGPGLVPGTLLAVGGVFLVTVQGTGLSLEAWLASARNPVAPALGLAGAFLWALHSNLARRWGPKTGGGAVPWFLLSSGAVFLLVAVVTRASLPRVSPGLMLETAGLAGITALGYLFWDEAMRAGDHTVVVAASYLVPFLSTVFSCVALRVAPGAWLWAGCAALIAGSLLSWASVRPDREPGPESS